MSRGLFIVLLCGLALSACGEKTPPPGVSAPVQKVKPPEVPPPEMIPGPDPRYIVPWPRLGDRIEDRIFFARSSARLSAKSTSKLDRFISLFNKYCRGGKVTIEGHTDLTGTRDRNMALSERRALAAARYLVAHGLDAGEINSVGYGWLNPAVLSNSKHPDKNIAENRRVVLIVNRKDCP